MGLFKKFRDAWFAPMSFDSLDDDFYDRLEESLILADVGMDVALDATEKLRRRAYDDRLLTADQVKGALREILAEKLEVGDSRLDLSTQPSVILVIGVNGVGKTTSIGKLAYQLKRSCCAPVTPFVPPPPTSWRSGPIGPGWTSSARTRARTPALCCSTPWLPPRPAAATWCWWIPPDACTTRRTS